MTIFHVRSPLFGYYVGLRALLAIAHSCARKSRTATKVKKRKPEPETDSTIVRGPTQRVDTSRLSNSGLRRYRDTDCHHLPFMLCVSLRY